MTTQPPAFPRFMVLLAVLSLSACVAAAPPETGLSADDPLRTTPPDAPLGSCWDKNVLAQPAQVTATGAAQSSAPHRSQTRPQIVPSRQETWTQMVCPTELTSVFVASLQRALAARGYYKAPVSAQIDTATRRAIADYQADTQTSGPAPGALTVAAAQSLGLWAVPRNAP